MNTKSLECTECKKRMLKISSQDSEGRAPLGYWCPECGKISDLNNMPLIPASVIISLTPGLENYSPGEVYAAIMKVIKNPEKYLESPGSSDPITQVRENLFKTFQPFCRKPGEHEKVTKLDREQFKKDLEKDFQKIIPKSSMLSQNKI